STSGDSGASESEVRQGPSAWTRQSNGMITVPAAVRIHRHVGECESSLRLRESLGLLVRRGRKAPPPPPAPLVRFVTLPGRLLIVMGYVGGAYGTESGDASDMKFYNTQSAALEPFQASGGSAGLYVCGITPYDTTHLGHAFTYATADVLVRYLESQGI